MIDPAFVQTMARYNAWQNDNLYTAAASLTDEARRQNRGAFFNSIHATFCHLLWGDRMWLHRLIGSPTNRRSAAATRRSMSPIGRVQAQARRSATRRS
jgi:uncharacterized damage-inducible protein DinB